jgi:hypothetical protein
VHLVGFPLKIFRDARPYKHQICEMQTFVKLTGSNKKKVNAEYSVRLCKNFTNVGAFILQY